jgi:DNA mismatch repair protein MutS2
MTINLINENHSVHHAQVEWNQLSAIISQFAYFDSNKVQIVSKIFKNNSQLLQQEFSFTQQYLRSLKDDHRQVLGQLFARLPADDSLEKFTNHISKNGTLNFQELNKLCILLECGQFLNRDFPKLSLNGFELIQALEFQPVSRKFLKDFRHLVDDTGEVHFERHPELADLNKRLRETEERIRRTVQEWISVPQNQKVLQFNSYDVHYDRYVVPVRSDSYRSEIGMIVSRSDSGSTLFVELYEVREACNRRLEIIAKIDEIINKLTIKYSQILYEFREFLSNLRTNIVEIDFYFAKASFSESYNLEQPTIREKPGFFFSQLFHPLLKNPVKNDAKCTDRDHGIVISGPNTGGKTVFLKSLALSYLLFYHGFFVPAAEAELYPYEGVFYFGNDLQDLKTGLSSFSGEVKNYIELIENVEPSNLILIDEIFNSTSSDEASALSLAYFDELHKKAICHIVVSTHHQMFKTLIHQDQNYISCHVGFDTKNMKPTYKIQWGSPGSSMAIDIFRILSRTHDTVSSVPEKALGQMNTKNVSYETLLQKVSQKQIEVDQILNSNRQLEIELRNQKGAMEGILNLRLQDELTKAKKEVEKIISEARNVLQEVQRQEITKLRKVEDRGTQLVGQVQKLSGKHVEQGDNAPVAGNVDLEVLKMGDIVYSQTLKKEFTVMSMDPKKSTVTIGKGPIKFTVPAGSLSYSKRAPQKPQVSVSFSKSSHANLEYDVRGMRLSEFQSLIDKALGDLLSGDVPYLNVVHGHGDGILKNWLRDFLKRSHDFKAEMSENGNDGETKIVLP